MLGQGFRGLGCTACSLSRFLHLSQIRKHNLTYKNCIIFEHGDFAFELEWGRFRVRGRGCE